MSDLNRDLIEQLLQRIDLLEKEMKHHKKKKMANKDYDKDGKVESSEEEYLGSRDRAIKKAQGKLAEENLIFKGGTKPIKKKTKKEEELGEIEVSEALDRIGGNVNNNSPSIRSLASKIEKSDLVEKVLNKLDEMNPMNKKSFKDHGTKVQLSENLVFGGFPRTKLNEGEESESLTAAPPFDPHNKVFYPSKEYAELHGAYIQALQAHKAAPSEKTKEAAMRMAEMLKAHPHHAEHQESIANLRKDPDRVPEERSSPRPGFEDPRLRIQGRSSIN
jgi:hypothetical protein